MQLASLNVTAGGHLTSVSGILGTSSIGVGTANISGDDGLGNASKWTIDSALHVGLQGTGVLEILAGGEVQSTTASMGAGSNAIGNVTVSGAGSTWTNTGNFQVGRGGAGDTATLTIQDQARVEIGGELDVFQTATVSLAGGTLIADMIDRSITSSFNFTGGRLQVANLHRQPHQQRRHARTRVLARHD